MSRFALLRLSGLVFIVALTALVLVRLFGAWSNSDADSDSSNSAQKSSSSNAYQLNFQKCWFKVPWRVEIHCAKLVTPEASGLHKLPVVIIRARGGKASASPLLYLQGGPGASAGLDKQGIEYWLDWIDYAQLERDLVLMDHRGAGLSEPRLDCPEYDRFSKEILAQTIELEEELIQSQAIVEQCYRELAAGSAKFSAAQFGTEQSAQDVLGLMDTLAYAQWNLLGVSYGSRLAMVVAASPEAQQKAWVRSLILDSVYPPGRGGIQSWPQVLNEGLQRFFRWCEESADCRGDSQNLESEFRRALAALKKTPVSVEVSLYQGGAPVAVMVDDQRFISAVFSAVYQRHRWGAIAPAIRAAQLNKRDELEEFMSPFINQVVDSDFSSLAFFAVDCGDHPVGTEADYRQALQDYPQYAHYLELGWRYQACHFLEQDNARPLSARKPLPDVPTLLLAGGLDPITPVDWAEDLHREWPQSQLAIFPEVGHAVIGTDACAHAHFRAFLRAPKEPWEPECLPDPISFDN